MDVFWSEKHNVRLDYQYMLALKKSQCVLSRIYVRWHVDLFKVILFLLGIAIRRFKKQSLSKNYKTILKGCPLNC